MGRIRLGVNIDHVATIRNARRTFEPDPVHAAIIADLAGADQITLHVREDRRHVNERDLELIKSVIHSRVNLEMAVTEEMINIALRVKPHQVTLVPERREEITTEGGLDVKSNFERIKDAISRLKSAGITVNIFIDPDEEQIKRAKEAGADAVELHTGRYAEAFAEGDEEKVQKELERLKVCAKFAKQIGLKVYAGHGLTYKNVKPVAEIPEIEELNIGHSIVANAVLFGLKEAVKEMIKLINEARKGSV
jgi:pyridoxine 5-phosphate synthase